MPVEGRSARLQGGNEMTDTTTLVDQYVAIWNEREPGQRAALIAETWTEDGAYLDPLMSGNSAAEIDAMIEGAQLQFPNHEIRKIGAVDAYNDRVRFSWELVNVDDGTRLLAGTDFATIAEDGRLRAVTGFLDSER
jgi:hypothetical protein